MADHITPKGITDEMAKLRKGRGVDGRDLMERVGTGLRLLCAIADTDDPAAARDRIAALFTAWAAALPDDLKVIFRAAFGLVPEARHAFVQDRLRWAGDQLKRDERTVRRRLDEACELVAERAIAQYRQAATDEEEPPSKEWHTEALHATLYLDQSAPEAFEVRRIVADRDDLRLIDLAVTVSGPTDAHAADPAGLFMDVLYGGSLVRRRMASTRRFGLSVALPTALDRGATHEFALRFRLPDGEALQPHFVCATEQRCDLMDVRVKFAEKRPPKAVWLMTRVFQGEVDDPAHRGDIVPLDAANEVHVRFHRPEAGFAYGVQWEEDEADLAGALG
jgi:hypothetical protein